jgi:hypothetical protein
MFVVPPSALQSAAFRERLSAASPNSLGSATTVTATVAATSTIARVAATDPVSRNLEIPDSESGISLFCTNLAL